MRNAVLVLAAFAAFPNVSAAQGEAAVGTVEPAGATSADTSSAETPAEEADSTSESKEDERGPYYKKVQGLLWIEFLVGPTAFDPDNYGSVSTLGGGQLTAPRLNGPEWGLAIGVGLGGFHLGVFYRRAAYDGYKLQKVGLDMKGIFRFVPFVHPMIRIDLYYAGITDGTPYAQLSNSNIDGGGFTLGAGVMVPIVRWVSFTATFDWSVIGFAVRGNEAGTGASVSGGIAGQELGATFALTFHFIGVRRNN